MLDKQTEHEDVRDAIRIIDYALQRLRLDIQSDEEFLASINQRKYELTGNTALHTLLALFSEATNYWVLKQKDAEVSESALDKKPIDIDIEEVATLRQEFLNSIPTYIMPLMGFLICKGVDHRLKNTWGSTAIELLAQYAPEGVKVSEDSLVDAYATMYGNYTIRQTLNGYSEDTCRSM
jgi:hypothetical protein